MIIRSFARPGGAPEQAVTAQVSFNPRYPSRVMSPVKTDGSLVRSARLGAWSQGCDEQITGDALRSRMREWLSVSSMRSFRRHVTRA